MTTPHHGGAPEQGMPQGQNPIDLSGATAMQRYELFLSLGKEFGVELDAQQLVLAANGVIRMMREREFPDPAETTGEPAPVVAAAAPADEIAPATVVAVEAAPDVDDEPKTVPIPLPPAALDAAPAPAVEQTTAASEPEAQPVADPAATAEVQPALPAPPDAPTAEYRVVEAPKLRELSPVAEKLRAAAKVFPLTLRYVDAAGNPQELHNGPRQRAQAAIARGEATPSRPAKPAEVTYGPWWKLGFGEREEVPAEPGWSFPRPDREAAVALVGKRLAAPRSQAEPVIGGFAGEATPVPEEETGVGNTLIAEAVRATPLEGQTFGSYTGNTSIGGADQQVYALEYVGLGTTPPNGDTSKIVPAGWTMIVPEKYARLFAQQVAKGGDTALMESISGDAHSQLPLDVAAQFAATQPSYPLLNQHNTAVNVVFLEAEPDRADQNLDVTVSRIA